VLRRTSPRARRVASLALGAALAPAWSAVAGASSPPAPTARVLSASAVPGELKYGAGLTVAGRLLDAGQGVGAAPLALQSAPYPFRRFVTLGRTTTGPNGSFAFGDVRPDRNTRLRVTVEGSPATTSPVLGVIVDPAVALNARSLGPGRIRLSLRVRHTPQDAAEAASAWWFVAARGTRVFRLAAVTPTRALSPSVSYASTTINPPSKRFAFRVCLNPPWERAMGPAATHRPCPEHGFGVRRNVG
jgi:hypothetical protein